MEWQKQTRAFPHLAVGAVFLTLELHLDVNTAANFLLAAVLRSFYHTARWRRSPESNRWCQVRNKSTSWDAREEGETSLGHPRPRAHACPARPSFLSAKRRRHQRHERTSTVERQISERPGQPCPFNGLTEQRSQRSTQAHVDTRPHLLPRQSRSRRRAANDQPMSTHAVIRGAACHCRSGRHAHSLAVANAAPGNRRTATPSAKKNTCTARADRTAILHKCTQWRRNSPPFQSPIRLLIRGI